jgi:hypothetical protein
LITPATDDDVVVTVELLERRGMRPVVVLLDATSFGGSHGSDRAASNLVIMEIPVCRVKNEDDLGAALATAAQSHMWT